MNASVPPMWSKGHWRLYRRRIDGEMCWRATYGELAESCGVGKAARGPWRPDLDGAGRDMALHDVDAPEFDDSWREGPDWAGAPCVRRSPDT